MSNATVELLHLVIVLNFKILSFMHACAMQPCMCLSLSLVVMCTALLSLHDWRIRSKMHRTLCFKVHVSCHDSSLMLCHLKLQIINHQPNYLLKLFWHNQVRDDLRSAAAFTANNKRTVPFLSESLCLLPFAKKWNLFRQSSFSRPQTLQLSHNFVLLQGINEFLGR